MNYLKRKNQLGLSLLGLIFVLGVGGVALLFGSQMGMGYITQQTLKGAVKNALIEAKVNDGASPKTIKESIMKKLSVNTIEIKESAIDVVKADGGFEVNAEYTKEIKISQQIKIVMDLSFTENSK